MDLVPPGIFSATKLSGCGACLPESRGEAAGRYADTLGGLNLGWLWRRGHWAGGLGLRGIGHGGRGRLLRALLTVLAGRVCAVSWLWLFLANYGADGGSRGSTAVCLLGLGLSPEDVSVAAARGPQHPAGQPRVISQTHVERS